MFGNIKSSPVAEGRVGASPVGLEACIVLEEYSCRFLGWSVRSEEAAMQTSSVRGWVFVPSTSGSSCPVQSSNYLTTVERRN